MKGHEITLFVFLSLIIFIPRMISITAEKKLDPEKRAELFTLNSKGRVLSLVLILAIVAIVVITQRFEFFTSHVNFVLYVILVLGWMGYQSIMSYRRLKGADFPDAFMKAYWISMTIRLAGIIGLIIVVPSINH